MTMTLAYDKEITIIDQILERAVKTLKKLGTASQRRKNETITLPLDHVEEVHINCEYENVEIKYAFNNKLVIQTYGGNHGKVDVYLPPGWNGTLELTTVHGDIVSRGDWKMNNVSLNTKVGMSVL